MQCLKCRQQIDDDSIYCKYCGKKQTKTEKAKELKKPNGYGSVIKLAGRRRKQWAVRVTDSISGGKQTYRYISYHETKKEALEALAHEQISPTPSKAKITFSELYNEWKQTKAYTSIAQDTKYSYSGAYNHFEKLYNMVFADLRTAHFQKCIDTATKKKGGKDIALSSSSKKHMKVLAGLLYKYAMENDITNKNYAQFIILDKTEKTKHKIFTSDEIQTMFDNELLPGADITLILIYTGMRINELLNLRKPDIDLTEKIITGGLKTDAGKDRTIPIHPKIYKYIEKYYISAADYLFMRNESNRLTDNYFREKMYKPLLNRLDIEYKTIHSTRHTFATMLTQSGANTKAIEELMGHSDYAFTADTYTTVDVDFLKNELLKL